MYSENPYDPNYNPDMLGFFNFKKMFKKIGKGLASVAKVVGPAIATVMPAAGPAVAAGMKLLKSSKKGNKKAKAKIAKIKLAAAQGNTTALKSLDTLLAAQEIAKQVKSGS